MRCHPGLQAEDRAGRVALRLPNKASVPSPPPHWLLPTAYGARFPLVKVKILREMTRRKIMFDQKSRGSR